jgi:hypothetical protein
MHSITATQPRIAKCEATHLFQSCVDNLNTETPQNYRVNMHADTY